MFIRNPPKKRARSGFSKWICSPLVKMGSDVISDLGYDWERDKRSPDHVNDLEEVLSYLRGSRACEDALEAAEIAWSVYEQCKKRNVSPGLRFKVLRRDNFTCRYCGRSAPNVELAVDHVIPYAKGGTCTEENLVTACVECNAGKRDQIL